MRGLDDTTSVAPTVDKDDENQDTLGAYKAMHKLHNRTVDLSHQCTFVGAQWRSISKHGHMSEVPSLNRMHRLGRAAGSKKRKDLGDGIGVEVDDGKDLAVATIQQSHELATDAVKGILACMSRRIPANLFAGRDVGWITVPGETEQTRVLRTEEAASELIGALTGSPITQPAQARVTAQVDSTRPIAKA